MNHERYAGNGIPHFFRLYIAYFILLMFRFLIRALTFEKPAIFALSTT
jgi:hypothetical protein